MASSSLPPRSSSTRERFLESKILLLEQRLTLVEKFVELRFKDAFQNFVASNLINPEEAKAQGGGDSDGDDVGTEPLTAAKSEPEPSPHAGTRGRGKSKVKEGKTETRIMARQTRKTRLLVEEHPDSESIGGRETKVDKGDDCAKPLPRYKTRRSKCSEKDSPEVKVGLVPVPSSSEHGPDPCHSRDDTDSKKKSRQMDMDSPVNQEEQEAADIFDIESYIEFPDEGKGYGTDGVMSETTKGTDVTSGTGSSTFYGDFLKIQLPTVGQKNPSRRRKSRKPVGSGRKPEGLSTLSKKKDTSVSAKTSINSNPQEGSPPKKRTYVPAICSTLPSVARADPSRKECPMCQMHIKNEHFEAHVDSHVKVRHLKCPFCDKTYFNQAMLRKHRMIHQPEKYGRPCRICEKMFFQNDKKWKHERFCVKRAIERNQHVDPEIIQDLKNRSPNWTVETERDRFTDSEERKECPHCHKMFNASFYQRHLKTHTETKQWVCKVCDKAYYHKHDLVRHFGAEHRPPICDLCSKIFKNKQQLADHVPGCRKKQGAMRLERKSTESKTVDSADIPVEFGATKPQTLVRQNEPILDVVQALESNPSFKVDGATVTILSEDLIVVANDIEVPQSEDPEHSLILVDHTACD